MRLFIYSSLVIMAILVGTLFLDRTIKVETSSSFNETEVYKFVRKWDGKYFGNCATWKNYLLTNYPEVKCYRRNISKWGHWECEILDGIWTDANYHLNGVVRIYRK
jgi:hypothetical protein